MVGNHLKIAWRFLWKNKTTGFISISCLSIGMTSAILIMLWVQNELSFDKYHPDAGNIYRVTFTDSLANSGAQTLEYSPLPLADAAKTRLPEIREVTRLFTAFWSIPVLNIHGELYKEADYAYVDDNWFNLFHYDFVKGDPAALFNGVYSILLTESKAKQYFGNRDPIDQVIRIDSTDYYVKAVVKDNPPNSIFQFNILIPISAYLSNPVQRQNENSWSVYNYVTFLKLRPHSDLDLVTGKLNNIVTRNETGGEHRKCYLMKLGDIHFDHNSTFSFARHGSREMVYTFALISFFLLLTACISNVNLSITQASMRIKEVSIRKIIGASAMNIAGQFITESLMISSISLAISILLCWICLPAFNGITENHLSLDLSSIGFWLLLSCTLLLVTFFNCIYPALLLADLSPLNIFRGITILKIKDVNFKKVLLVIQFCISVALISSAAIIFQQLNFINDSNAGYSRAGAFSVPLPVSYFLKHNNKERNDLMNNIRQALAASSSVANVTVASHSVTGVQNSTSLTVDWPGKNANLRPSIAVVNADSSYDSFFNLQLDAGRWFEDNNAADEHNYILNETAVREFDIRRPVIGREFMLNKDSGRIIGILKDFPYKSLRDKIGPLIIYDHPGRRLTLFIRSKPGHSAEALQAARSAWNSFIPDYPFEYLFLDDEYKKIYSSEIRASVLIFDFAVISFIISILGLLGLSALIAGQKAKEIGIRKILGASTSGIIVLLAKDFIRLLLIAVVIAITAVSLIMNNWLQGFAYRINIGAGVFLVTSLLSLSVVLIIICLTTLRVTTGNPVRSLRIE